PPGDRRPRLRRHARTARGERLRGPAEARTLGLEASRGGRAERSPGRADGAPARRLSPVGACGYDAAVRHPVQDFNAEERAPLAPHFTNIDRPVFALVNLPETVKGALFARYSRYSGTVRRLYLEEFAGDVGVGGRPFDGAEGDRAAKLYERVFLGYGD